MSEDRVLLPAGSLGRQVMDSVLGEAQLTKVAVRSFREAARKNGEELTDAEVEALVRASPWCGWNAEAPFWTRHGSLYADYVHDRIDHAGLLERLDIRMIGPNTPCPERMDRWRALTSTLCELQSAIHDLIDVPERRADKREPVAWRVEQLSVTLHKADVDLRSYQELAPSRGAAKPEE